MLHATSSKSGYSGLDVPRTHSEHLQALVKLNLFDDTRIEMSFDKLNKVDFCTKKVVHKFSEEEDFNPFSTAP